MKPFTTATYNVTMLVWSFDGAQYAGGELSEMLTDAGFQSVEIRPAFGPYSIVTGIKP